MMHVEITNGQSHVAVDEARLCAAVRAVLATHGRKRCQVSVAIVDDRTVHALNRRHLDHDFPTDVLSFALETGPEYVDGEIIASGETAAFVAPQFGWPAEHELLLYVIHGALHLAGFDDRASEDAAEMRRQETLHLGRLGIRRSGQDAMQGRISSRATQRRRSAEGSKP
ncbi:MAG: rRNA maturation RNase YbeY [Planctomycetia bacterium]|nr:rRNA maturation RNase YbeY [Planctomycetia bacterium]